MAIDGRLPRVPQSTEGVSVKALRPANLCKGGADLIIITLCWTAAGEGGAAPDGASIQNKGLLDTCKHACEQPQLRVSAPPIAIS